MPIYEFANTDLLALLHSGLFETPMWRGFLERLRERTQADHCEIYFRRADAPATESTSVSAGNARPIHVRQLYDEIFHRLDPLPYDKLREGRVYSLSEFMLPGDERHEQYRRDYMVPSGMNHKRIMRITGGTDYNAWLTIWSGKRDFGAAADSLLSRLAPHISIALRTYEMIERGRIRLRIADEAVRRLNFGWLTLDGRGHIVDIDTEAERLLEAMNGRQPLAAARLRLPHVSAERKLADALAEFDKDQAARPRAIHLNDDPSLDMLLLPMRDRALSGARTPVLIAYLHGDNGPRAQRIDQLIDLFGLSRSEAKMALSLSRGRTIAETAKELDLTIETARNYSKRIYSKTGARGQADLVRIVLASVVALV